MSFGPRDRFGGILANNWCRKVVEDSDALDGKRERAARMCKTLLPC